MKPVEIQQITQLPSQIHMLEMQAAEEGFRFLTRLIVEWGSGANSFDAPGECLMAASLDGCLIGIGGVSVDPYMQNGVGRLRRLYVSPVARRQNVGRVLVERLVERAAGHFRIVRLSTDTTDGDAFYLQCGFRRTNEEGATHIMELGR
ncbi:GNAT superfamily N-acetyltransferase [Pseudomonas viridiflava]|uniref:GNAT family N-acetyltransferase n=1 Tax=Pseudomonas viridiflava TaxID=33069 RepID=UPI000F019630|nr:GNAT family N-acetyltransferase [Pseudomonas viridiflava]MDY0918890.1 GNAT family N-acetyltransferase [Pseudomonas viridiflava]MEE4107408.1 GNAT family N-acetyltransferase [Pseudomonas viridiflava]MEE4223711.1 GNAT family N-acetyltransferase [Pseudomonas viridiflava]